MNPASKLDSRLPLGWSLEASKKSKRAFRHFDTEKHFSNKSSLNRAISYSESGHLATFARTGSGKGVSTIIPTLLSHTGPVITIDPKGENFFVTAEYRRRVLGQKIYVIDPFGVLKNHDHKLSDTPSSGLNVFSPLISDGRSIEKSDSSSIARLLIGTNPMTQSDPYWYNSSEELLTGIIHFILTSVDIPQGQKTLKLVMEFLSRPDLERFMRSIMREYQVDEYARRSMEGFLGNGETQKPIIRGITKANISLFDSDPIIRTLSDDSIDMDLIRSGRGFSIYIVMPPQKLVSHARVFQMILSALLGKVMQRTRIPDQRTLFLVDECAQLGAFDDLRKAVTLMRGFGLQVWMFFQDLSQIQDLYPNDWKSLLNNCGVVQAFGISREFDAEALSSVLSMETSELIQLGSNQQILSIVNDRSHVCGKFSYLNDRAFSGRYSPNPFYQ